MVLYIYMFLLLLFTFHSNKSISCLSNILLTVNKYEAPDILLLCLQKEVSILRNEPECVFR